MQQRTKLRLMSAVSLGAVMGMGGWVWSADVVNDTWIDGSRTDPASPVYSENGVDADADGNLESAWFNGGSGSISVVNAAPGAGPGILQGGMSTSSASWTTYFTPEAAPVALGVAGDQFKLTWAFTLTGANAADTSQSFRMAFVDSPAASRIVADSSPGNAAYAGYGIFGNMANTLGNTNPFQLRERTDVATASALLSAAGSWTSLDDEENSGTTGYADATLYTLVFLATRTAGADLNDPLDDGLDILATMSGGSIGGDGQLTVSFLDATPNSFSFDTFQIRPSADTSSAARFDTSLFRVEAIVVPEPASGLLLLAAGALRRRRR